MVTCRKRIFSLVTYPSRIERVYKNSWHCNGNEYKVNFHIYSIYLYPFSFSLAALDLRINQIHNIAWRSYVCGTCVVCRRISMFFFAHLKINIIIIFITRFVEGNVFNVYCYAHFEQTYIYRDDLCVLPNRIKINSMNLNLTSTIFFHLYTLYHRLLFLSTNFFRAC